MSIYNSIHGTYPCVSLGCVELEIFAVECHKLNNWGHDQLFVNFKGLPSVLCACANVHVRIN
jgi:hypothetical protein